MELILKRIHFSEECTIGELSHNGTFICHILEDKDRNLTSTSSIDEKVHSKTAIPYGKYEIILNFSNRFQTILPLLMNVPLYLGIRIHPGNTALDTDGCLLPGVWDGKSNKVISSRVTFAKLFALLKRVWKTEKIFITVTK